jgi:hypothetical protein
VLVGSHRAPVHARDPNQAPDRAVLEPGQLHDSSLEHQT